MHAFISWLKVYERLQKLNLSVSHMSVNRLIDSVGEDFDQQVMEWRESFILDLNDVQVNLTYKNYRKKMY